PFRPVVQRSLPRPTRSTGPSTPCPSNRVAPRRRTRSPDTPRHQATPRTARWDSSASTEHPPHHTPISRPTLWPHRAPASPSPEHDDGVVAPERQRVVLHDAKIGVD